MAGALGGASCDIMSCLVRVYPNSTAERDAPAVLAPAPEGGGVPLTINFDAMALALELAALRTSNERASRREFALVSPDSLQDTALGMPAQCDTLALLWQSLMQYVFAITECQNALIMCTNEACTPHC